MRVLWNCFQSIMFLTIKTIGSEKQNAGVFDSAGHLPKFELATQASSRGGTVIGAHNKKYAVLLAWSNVEGDAFLLPSNRRNVWKINDGMAASAVGVASDCFHLVDKIHEMSSKSLYIYQSNPIGARLVSEIANYMHRQSLVIERRMFGAKLCIACFDNTKGPQIYEIDTFGNVYSCKLTCLGPRASEIIEKWKEYGGGTKIGQCDPIDQPNEHPKEDITSGSSLQDLVKRAIESLKSSIMGEESGAVVENAVMGQDCANNELEKDFDWLTGLSVSVGGVGVPFFDIDATVLSFAIRSGNYDIIEEFVERIHADSQICGAL